MAITPLPTPPSRGSSPTTFSNDADTFLGALPQFASETNATATDITNKQVLAGEAANDAEGFRDEAEAFKNTAQTQAGIATTQAGISTTQAVISTTKAGESAASAAESDSDAIIATNQAGNAQTYATNAGNSATASAASATAANLSKVAAGTSETNSAASAAAALSSKNAAGVSETNSASSASTASGHAATAAAAALTAVNAPGTNAVSTTSNTIGTGTKTWTIPTGKQFGVGQFVIASRTSAPSNFMVGQVATGFDPAGTSMSIVVADIDDTHGSGTFTDWTISVTAYASTANVVPDDGSITLAKLADMAQGTIIGRAASSGTGVPVALTSTQVKAILALAAADISGLGSLATVTATVAPGSSHSGNNTGDQTTITGNAGTATALATPRNIDGVAFNGTANIAVIAPGIHAATPKTTPVDADEFGIVDTAAANVLKRLTWLNVKATLKSYFDNIYQAASTQLANFVALTTTGFRVQTGTNTWAARTFAGGGGITVTNGNGVAGDPTISISNKKTLWIPAAAFRPGSSSPCGALHFVGPAGNNSDVSALPFDSGTFETAQFVVRFPKSWDKGTITAQVHWAHGATTTNFGTVWEIQGVSIGNGESLLTAFGTGIKVTDTGGSTNTLYISDETAAITIGGTPANNEHVQMRINRLPAETGDTMAIDAELLGVAVYYTINTLDDA